MGEDLGQGRLVSQVAGINVQIDALGQPQGSFGVCRPKWSMC
jgi:hypothetical protein